MSQTYDSFDELRVKHLEMIQAVITRLAHNSFLVNGWAFAVARAFFGFAASRGLAAPLTSAAIHIGRELAVAKERAARAEASAAAVPTDPLAAAGL